MKKLMLSSLVFVVTVMISVTVFAQSYNITEYCGENGLIDRNQAPQFEKGDVLNVKNDITQAMRPEDNRILSQGITINGNGHTLDGNGYGGFIMEKYDSGSIDGIKSQINNATITNHGAYINQFAISVGGSYSELTLKNVNIIDNYNNSIIVDGGAIVNIIADGKDVEIYNNGSGIKVDEYSELNLKGGNILLADDISLLGYATNSSKLSSYGQFSGEGDLDNTGTINLYNSNEDFTGYLYVRKGTIRLGVKTIVEEGDSYDILGGYFNNATEHFYENGTLDAANGVIDDISMQKLGIEGNMKINMDVDLEGQESDYFDIQDVWHEEDGSKITLNKINVMTDTEEQTTTIEVANSNSNAKDYIHKSVDTVFGPMYGYKVSFEEAPSPVLRATGGSNDSPTTGNVLVFERLDIVNPEILQGLVSVAGTNVSQEEVFDTVFNNAGNYTFFQKQGTSAGDVEDRAAPTLWVKAFGSQEDVDLDKYTKVKTNYYGAVVGLDCDRQYTNNFDATYGIFASYVGGELKDEDNDNKVKQQGGYLGLRANWYIGKLFINGILDYGMLSNSADTTSDSNDFNSNVIGLAARVGYNFEIAKRSFTIQPSLGVTGKYIITDDFETIVKSGDKLKEELADIKNVTIEPGLKLAKTLGKCWILTGEGKYVIENYDGTSKVDELVLPDTTYGNYANLGLGIEKIWGYTIAHLKVNKTFGGRDGFVINAGVEFKF